MFKKAISIYPLHYCCLLFCLNVFSQTVIYKPDFLFKNFQSASPVRPMGSSQKLLDLLLVANNKILFNHDSENQIKINDKYIFTLTKKQLLVLDNSKKKVLQLDLETAFPTDDFTPNTYSSILATTTQNVWFCYQNFLIHYDFKNNKRLRKVDLTKWNPHQILLDNRTIWLISKNDGQLYGLDFEPDEKIAYTLEVKARMDAERWRCPEPDLKKIEAAKAAQEKFKNKE